MRSLGQALLQCDGGPYKKRKQNTDFQREEDVKMPGEDGIHQPRREASEETDSA